MTFPWPTMKLNHSHTAQYEALTSGVGVAPLAGRAIIDVTGDDRSQILQSFTTNDIKQLSPGRGCEAFVTNTQGKTLGHVLIFCAADKYVFDTTPGQAATLIEHFQRYVITEDVQFTDRSAEFCACYVAGPKARECSRLSRPRRPANRSLGPCRGSPSMAGPRFYAASNTPGHSPTSCKRRSAIPLPSPQSFPRPVPCRAKLTPSKLLAWKPASRCLASTLRPISCRRGRPRRPHNQLHQGLLFGQETVARIDAVGHVNRLLVGLKFSGEQLPPRGLALLLASSKWAT